MNNQINIKFIPELGREGEPRGIQGLGARVRPCGELPQETQQVMSPPKFTRVDFGERVGVWELPQETQQVVSASSSSLVLSSLELSDTTIYEP